MPRKKATALVVAELYRKRWTIETAFQEVAQNLQGEIETLAPEVVQRASGQHRVEVVTQDRQAQPGHVNPQLMGPPRAGREPVATEAAAVLDQLDAGLGVHRAGLLAGADHPALFDDPAAHGVRQG